MTLTDMKIGMRVWFKYPHDKLFGFGIISKVAHRVRIEFNQRGMHGKSIFAYSVDVYPEEDFKWCEECHGDGWVNFSHSGPMHPGELPDEKQECGVCIGKGVLTVPTKTKTIKA